jgi:hypothetical protein
VVAADAAWASQANLKLLRPRGSCFALACARTWRFANGPTLKDLVTPLPNKRDRRCWVPLDEPGRRRTSWPSTPRAGRRPLGEVTSILSQQRRHAGPQQTNMLVTKLPEVTARQVVEV